MINPGDDTFATEAHSDSMQVRSLNLPRFCMWNKRYTFILHAMCSISRVSLGQVLEEWVSGSCTWNLKRYFLYQKFTALLTRKTFLLKCILFLNVVCFKEWMTFTKIISQGPFKAILLSLLPLPLDLIQLYKKSCWRLRIS